MKKWIAIDQIKYHATELWEEHKHRVKYVAVAAAIGAVIAIPVPVIGPNGGAIIGALAGIALLIKKHAVEIGNAPPKTAQAQILELNKLLDSGKISVAQHELLVDALLRPR